MVLDRRGKTEVRTLHRGIVWRLARPMKVAAISIEIEAMDGNWNREKIGIVVVLGFWPFGVLEDLF